MSIERTIGGKGISVLKMDKGETKAYEWTFIIPPRSTIANTYKAFSAAPHHEFSNLKFTTGFLKDVDHSIDFQISRNLTLHVKLKIQNTDETGFLIGHCELQTLERETLKGTVPFSLSVTSSTSNGGGGEWETYYSLTVPEDVWDDSVDSLKIIINIQKESLGKCINLPPLREPTSNDFQKYFLSDNLSDVTLMAGGQKFSAHRVILSGRSSVFERMFQNPMKEANEGFVDIEDIGPEVLKELLHFIYTCEFSSDHHPEIIYVQLLKAADKYAMEDLKSRCAEKIEATMTPENAVEICVLGDAYNEPGLMNTAIEIVKRNRAVALKDPNTARDLLVRCPKLAFDLMLMQN